MQRAQVGPLSSDSSSDSCFLCQARGAAQMLLTFGPSRSSPVLASITSSQYPHFKPVPGLVEAQRALYGLVCPGYARPSKPFPTTRAATRPAWVG